MAKNNRPLSEQEQKDVAQKFMNERLGQLGLTEPYEDLLRGIFAPMYARKPIITQTDMDSFVNPMWSIYEREISISADRNKRLKDYCFAGRTKVPLLDGRRLSFVDLVSEYGDGTPFYVYSYDEEIGDVTVGIARNPRLTAYRQDLVRVTLDSGSFFDCTIDHLCMLRSGDYDHACKLDPGTSLMPFYEHWYGDYTKYHAFNSLRNGKVVATHKMVADWLGLEVPTGHHIHHVDFDSLNNRPDNFDVMSKDDHFALHSQVGSSNLSRFLHKLWSSPEFRAKMSIVNSENGRRNAVYLNTDLEIRERRTKAIRNSEAFIRTRANGAIALNKLESTILSRDLGNLNGTFLKARVQKVVDEVSRQGLDICEQDYEFARLSLTGYKGLPKWPTYERFYNHKVVSVELLPEPEDVYCITVDKSNFALDAGVFVHNCDMGEDPMISSALDIYASETCQYSDEHGATVWVTSQDPTIVEESHRLFQQVEYEDYIEGIVRDTAQNGDDFVGVLYNFRDGVVRLKFVDPDEVTIKTDRYGRLTGYRYQENKKDIEPWNFVHFKNIGKKQSAKRGGSVYGSSLIEPARRVWRQLRMMEDAMVIWRMDIGNRRMVFYIDVGNLSQEEAMKSVRDWERAYKKKAYYNPCLIGSTPIKRLNGTRPTIKELADSNENQYWVYSFDNVSRKIVPGLASGARKTGEKVPVWKVTYDNNEFDITTWNHQFMMRDGSYVSMGDLRVGDSLMPLYSKLSDKEEARSMYGPAGYEILYQPEGKWEYTHRVTAPSYPEGLREQSSSHRIALHHYDFNNLNNDPSNLKWMTWEDHYTLHEGFGKIWGPVNVKFAIEWIRTHHKEASEKSKKWWAEATQDFREATGKRLSDWNKSEEGRKVRSDLMTEIWQRQEFRETRSQSSFEPHSPETDKRFNTEAVTNEEILKLHYLGFSCSEMTEFLSCDVRLLRRRMAKIEGFSKEIQDQNDKRVHSERISKNRQGVKFDETHKQSLKDAWVLRREREQDQVLNHKIVSIEFYGYEDVYNMDVDIYENFATGSGVFVHNSTGEFISRHSPLALDCLTGNTPVPLLDGTRPTIKELAETKSEDEFFEIFSFDTETMKPVVRWAHCPRLIHKNHEISKLTLDNGESIRCSPNHRWLTREGSLVRTCDLVPGQSMMPFNTKRSSTSLGDYLEDYSMIWIPSIEDWMYVHRLNSPSIPSSMRDSLGRFMSGIVLHHVDFNRLNNSKFNLNWMTWEDHKKLHSENWERTLGKYTGSEAHFENLRKSHNDPIARAKQAVSLVKTFNSESGAKLRESWECNRKDMSENWGDPFFVHEHYKRLRQGKVGFASWINAQDGKELMKPVWRKLGSNHASIYNQTQKSSDMARLTVASQYEYRKFLRDTGFSKELVDYRTFRLLWYPEDQLNNADRSYREAYINRNHKVVSVEPAGFEDVYCMEVPGTHIFGVEAGIFSENSHIFWPIRPTSRSRVEYIGGDANVSAVTDVDYMKRKMAATLKIPLAYMGGDEYSSVRTGLSQLDVYFARCTKKLQRSAIRGTGRLLFTHLRLREVPYSTEDVRVNMEPISGIEEMQRIEALTASVNLAQGMFMLGQAMGIPPNIWVPYLLKDILKISDDDILKMPIDMDQIQQVQDMQASQDQPGGPDGGGGQPGGQSRKEGYRDEIRQKITEELQKREYANLRKYLASESETDIALLAPDVVRGEGSEQFDEKNLEGLIPQVNGKVPRIHKGRLTN